MDHKTILLMNGCGNPRLSEHGGGELFQSYSLRPLLDLMKKLTAMVCPGSNHHAKVTQTQHSHITHTLISGHSKGHTGSHQDSGSFESWSCHQEVYISLHIDVVCLVAGLHLGRLSTERERRERERERKSNHPPIKCHSGT